MTKGYVIVYADNMQELVNTVVYEHKDVAIEIMKNYQSMEKDSELDVQPIDVDRRTIDKLAR